MRKLFFGLVALWVLCGSAAAFLMEGRHKASLGAFALGPLSLAQETQYHR